MRERADSLSAFVVRTRRASIVVFAHNEDDDVIPDTIPYTHAGACGARDANGGRRRHETHTRVCVSIRAPPNVLIVSVLRSGRGGGRVTSLPAQTPPADGMPASAPARSKVHKAQCAALARARGRARLSLTLTVRVKELALRQQRQRTLMILPQVHLRKPCYDFYFL